MSEADIFKSFTVSDFLFQKSIIFAMNTLTEDEAKLYRTLFDIINQTLPKPDLVVYLYAPVDKLLSNIKRRGRDCEQNIKAEYLAKIQNAYLEFFKLQHHSRIVLLDTTNINFADKQEDYEKVIELLSRDFEPGINYV